MIKKNMNVVRSSALALVLSLGLVACGDDDDDMPMTMSDAGRDSGGDGGGADVDSGGDGDGGGDGGTPDVDGGADAGDIDAGFADAGPIDCTPTTLLVTTSNFAIGALATYDLATGVVTVSPTAAADQDTLPVRAGCDTYLVEGSSGRVRRQVGGDALNTAVSIDVDPTGTPATEVYVSSPQRVIEAAGSTFVTRYSLQSAVRIDPAAGTVIGEVDFSALAATYSVGAVDVVDTVDMSNVLFNDGRLLVGLGRFYFDSTFALLYAGPSLIALVDPVAGTVTDTDPAVAGVQGIELPVGNPGPIVRLDDDVVLVTCTDDGFTDDDGVLFAIDIPSRTVTATAATEATLGGFKGLATTEDARVFLAAGGALLELMSDTGTVIDTLVPASVGVTGFVIYGDSAFVIADGALRVWSLATGAETTAAPVRFGEQNIYGIALAR